MFSAEYHDLATPRLKQILAALNPAQRRAMMTRLGKELERQLKAWFQKREGDSPNKQGFPRSHFWIREVRDKTALRTVTPDTATVGIDSIPFAHKVTGGVIRPGPGKKFLAIPLRAEAYAVLPRANTIPGIFFVRVGGRPYLAARDGKALRIYWRLVQSVKQSPDPKALPPPEDLRHALELRGETEVLRILKR